LLIVILFSCVYLSPIQKARKYAKASNLTEAHKWFQIAIEEEKDDLIKVFYIREKCSLYLREGEIENLKDCAKLFYGLEKFSAIIVPWLEQAAQFLAESVGVEDGRSFLEEFYNIDPDYMEGILDRYIKAHFKD